MISGLADTISGRCAVERIDCGSEQAQIAVFAPFEDSARSRTSRPARPR